MYIISNVKYLHVKYVVITVGTFGFWFLSRVFFLSPFGINNKNIPLFSEAQKSIPGRIVLDLGDGEDDG